jgi:hypothetical protein
MEFRPSDFELEVIGFGGVTGMRDRLLLARHHEH